MFLYKLKLCFRSLAKDKVNSIINIFGLAVGMAAVILITIYVQHELSYDKFNTKHERIHRIISRVNDADGITSLEICKRLTDDNFANQIPEIEEITQLFRGSKKNARVGDQQFTGIRYHYVDTNFHKVFTLEPISGQSIHLLSNPNGVVMNATTAKKLFGTTNAGGKEFEMFGKLLKVNTVVKDLPLASHYDFDILLPFSGFSDMASFKGLDYLSYVLLKQGIDETTTIKKIENRYTQILNNYFKEHGKKARSYLQKLSDIHLRSDYETKLKPAGNLNTIYIHILLAFLILAIAIVNFINVTIASYDEKLNQIGIKKTIGAERSDLIRDFMGRTLLMSSIALLFGIIISEILLPSFSNLVNRELRIEYLSNPILYGLPSMTLLVGLLSGSYPAITITRYKPASIIKGNLQTGRGKNLLSRILLIFQFTTSFVLISVVINSQQQISYMKKTDLGFKPEHVIAITNISDAQAQGYSAIKQELLKLPEVSLVSASEGIPGGRASGQNIHLNGANVEDSKNINQYRVGPNYFQTLGIQILEGQGFDESQIGNCKGIILNEAAVKSLGIDDPLGSLIWFRKTRYVIQAVVKDFHYTSLQEKISPLMFTCIRYNGRIGHILFKMKTNDVSELLSKVKKVFKNSDPSRTNDHLFIDDMCRNRYQQEERSQALTTYSSVLSILLALLGLYSLTLFIVQKRTKEIGIRKVSGASALQITTLFFSTYAKWLTLSFIIAIPISWYIMNQWLEQYAYRTQIGVLPFLFSGLITAVFALLVVGIQTWKAANQNPVDSLRSE